MARGFFVKLYFLGRTSECIGSLHRALYKVVDGMEHRYVSLYSSGRVRNQEHVTCEMIQIFVDLVHSEYEATPGCDMGYPNEVFLARVLSIVKRMVNEDCDLFRIGGQDVDVVASSLVSITCTPDEEVTVAATKYNECLRPAMEAQDLCARMEVMGPCLEGILDRYL